jgi:hypothetical protein
MAVLTNQISQVFVVGDRDRTMMLIGYKDRAHPIKIQDLQ